MDHNTSTYYVRILNVALLFHLRKKQGRDNVKNLHEQINIWKGK